MNTSRRIPRVMVKAVAAGAVMLAAALPMAFASVAGAATAPSLSGATVSFNTTAADGGNGTQTSGDSFGQGGSGEISVTGATGLAYDGGTATVTSSAPGLTFSSVVETSATSFTASFASTSATLPALYSLTVTDDNGASAADANAFTVNPAPTLSATVPVVPATISDGAGAASVATVVTGTGFGTDPTVVFTNATNNTVLVNAATAAAAATALTADTTTAGTDSTGASVNVTGNATTELDTFVDPNNDFNGSLAIPGAYTVTVTNPDGGTVTSGSIYTVTPYGITNLSPSALPSLTTLTTTDVTIAGAGFQSGAGVTITSCTGVTFNPTTIAANVTSSTSITAVIAYSTAATTTEVRCTVTVTNPNAGAGGNGATYTLANALGFGESSGVAATVTATSDTTPIVPGAATSAITFTGTGFSQYSLVTVYAGTSGTTAPDVAVNDCTGNTGTSLVCEVTVQATGAAAGSDNIVVTNNGVASGPLAAGVVVAGPVITSSSPAAIAVGAPVGTAITLNGTGFTSTTAGTVTDNGVAGLNGIISYVSPTAMLLTITSSPVALNQSTPADVPVVTLTQTVAAGVTVTSAPFDIAVDVAPTVSGLTYAAGTGVGVGATAQTVYIHGTGFAAGATVGSFVNGSGAADANVTAKVVTVTPTLITATIAIATGDTNIADGYTVSNADGGTAKVAATLNSLIIDAGPTITGVTPATATASGTTAFTIAGTNFEAGVTVAASSDGTCGTATVVSTTSLTVSCTLGAATATPVTLIVTNVDGGSAISAAVLAMTAPVAPAFHVSKVNGSAVAGKTVTITISGTGFNGQPKIKSSLAGVRAVVSHDSGKLLTVRITTPKTGKGEHTLTVTLSSGKSGKVNYATKA
jgi:hypothetical protein